MKLGSNRHRMTSAKQILEFILGGAAVISLKSLATNKHFTYRIKKKEDVYFVTFLSAGSSWAYIGYIDKDLVLKKDRRVIPYTRGYPAWEAIEWFWPILNKGRIPQDAEVYHEGKCAMCGRKLTDPISVSEGVGPECRNKRLHRDFRFDTVVK